MNLYTCKAIVLIGMPLVLAACGGGGAAPVTGTSSQPLSQPPVSTRPVPQTDADIAALIYSDSQRTPVGFHVDDVPTVQGYVSTSHLKSTDIGIGARPYELCSDDWNQALQWSETAAGSGSSYQALTGNSDSPMYFEFDRLREGTPQGYVRQRVFKCGFVDRDDVDLREAAGSAGVLNVRPDAAVELQNLSEYLWQFTTYNNFGSVVLVSRGESAAGALTHSLYIATLISGTAPACDSIQVVEWQHRLDPASGALTRSVTPVWSFKARQQQGSVSLCAP